MPTIKSKTKKKPFNPEGGGYDYQTALKHGIKPKKGHWPSFSHQTGVMLKGMKHRSIGKTKKVEAELGNRIIKRGKRYYTAK